MAEVKLVGTRTNRSALGARIRVELKGPDGARDRSIASIGNNGSFGGNSLVELVGLGDAKVIDSLTVSWPTSRTTQTFHDLAADQAIEITEGSRSFKVLHQPRIALPREQLARLHRRLAKRASHANNGLAPAGPRSIARAHPPLDCHRVQKQRSRPVGGGGHGSQSGWPSEHRTRTTAWPPRGRGQ